jgi:hypothetical protein
MESGEVKDNDTGAGHLSFPLEMEGSESVVVVFISHTSHAIGWIFHLLQIDANQFAKEILREVR